MLISTEIGSAAKIVGEEKAVELVAEAGFDAWDFSMFEMVKYDWDKWTFVPSHHRLAGDGYLQLAKNLKHIATECGIVCNQAHAPFPTCYEILPMIKRAIECAAEVGAKICVVHPQNNESPESNAELFSELLPFAKSCNVKIATENMFNWDNEKGAQAAACGTAESFNAHLDAVNDDFFVACLDIGHAEMLGDKESAVRMIHALGARLQALHIHDNDRYKDLHQIPFSMKIDFDGIIRALKEINYSGDFTLEADQYLSKFDENNISDGLRDLYNSAVKFKTMFDRQ